MNSQVVSKKRVVDHGEVFTNPREVNAMLDLVKQETERIDSRFLEPACGTGNFLTEILERKLAVVKSRYRRSQLEYERALFSAVCSLYGIDILEDNVLECRARLFAIANRDYTTLFKTKCKEELRSSMKYVLARNIIWGDALTLQTVGPHPGPITFSEWSFPFNNSQVQRRDFVFADLMPGDKPKNRQADLFKKPDMISDLGKRAFIPQETKSFAPIHFTKVGEGYAG